MIRLIALGSVLILIVACTEDPQLSRQGTTSSSEARVVGEATLPPPPATATPTPESSSPTRSALSPTAPATSTASNNPTRTSVDVRFKIWLDPAVPFSPVWTADIRQVDQAHDAMLRFVPGSENAVTHWIYALVAPFPEVRDDVSFAEMQSRWRGQFNGQLGPTRLLVTEQTRDLLSRFWGEPAADAVELVEQDEMLETAWSQRPAWAIIPFEQLQPRWKVLTLEGQSPLHKTFDRSEYKLAIPLSLIGNHQELETFLTIHGPGSESETIPDSNRDAGKLTTVVMTGVTALVRATAWTMEAYGLTYPAQDIRHWLRQADITHISNEVPFAENCPYPDSQQQGVVFCSDTRYIDLLEDVGTDVVELTGDHFHDWGSEAMLLTLEMYQERGWKTYGGGVNYNEGRKPIVLTHNGNRIAFIGCNGKGGSFARATAANPGSVACDIGWMQGQIADLSSQGILVIATFQHIEHYGYTVPGSMKPDFRAAADSGAAVISGSQAHHPHGFEFRNGGLIHYGLGNLFFDQYAISEGTRQGFVDRHVFYDGRYISTELLTLEFVDYARSRPMLPGEREALLRNVFSASGW